MNKKIATAISISLILFSSATYADYILLESNTFSGQVTDINVKDGWAEAFKGGDIGVGSRFDANFRLYDVVEDPGLIYFVSEYTFYGHTRNYTFEIDADPFRHNSWGSLNIDSSGLLTVRFDNNFDSDGLEQTFHDHGGDYGGFWIDLYDYNKPTINGFGDFGWEGFDIYFSVSPSTSINEPASWWLLLTGTLTLLVRKKLAKVNAQPVAL